jgi:hypothetical protein
VSLANLKEANPTANEKLVVSKERVVGRGEVYTSWLVVNAMLDLVGQETERIESRFLEPACGTGNFLVAILERKLAVVASRYRRGQLDYERNAILAVSSLYGIDILEDNVARCRQRLFEVFDQEYTLRFKKKTKEGCRKAVRFILEKNIIWGDALTLRTVGDDPQPITFSEWSPVNGSVKRRDFAFKELISEEEEKTLSFFSEQDRPRYSDIGGRVFIPLPLKEYPLIQLMRVWDAERQL